MSASRLAVLAVTAALALALAGCTSAAPGDAGATAEPTASTGAAAGSTPASSASAPAADGFDSYCAATVAAAEAKAGTVGEDITAVRAQADAARALLPLSEAPAEVAAGAEVLARSADETVTVLEQFPADSSVADVGLDPRFVAVAQKAVTDPAYQAFIGWTIQTCGLMPSGG